MSRTKKRPYTKAKRVDRNCRNHGTCKWCRDNRTHKHRRSLSSYEIDVTVTHDELETEHAYGQFDYPWDHGPWEQTQWAEWQKQMVEKERT